MVCLLIKRELQYCLILFSGGFYTPGAAFGNTDIVQNLEQTGKLKFTIEQV